MRAGVMVCACWVGCVRFNVNPQRTDAAPREDAPTGLSDGPRPDVARRDVHADALPPGHDAPRPDAPRPDAPRPDPASGVPGTWVYFASGSFMMGSPASEPCRNANETQHQVTLAHGFELMSTEVTRAQFQSILGGDPSADTACGASCPVESVTWHAAAAYCNALSGKAGLVACYSCSASVPYACTPKPGFITIHDCPGYRLPTEAEWEYAYRASTITALYSGAFSGGCSTANPVGDAIGWYDYNSGGAKHVVGAKQANAKKVYDMAGNVWEWVNDWYQDDLTSLAVTDPVGPTTGTERVVRGGSFSGMAMKLRGAHRESWPPLSSYGNIGFRCLRSLP
jgi:formylglycine-generating enzyme required for sulfatase activity